jgi:hypothetical protein
MRTGGADDWAAKHGETRAKARGKGEPDEGIKWENL